MKKAKYIRTVCVFAQDPNDTDIEKATQVAQKLEAHGYIVQTKRIASTINSLDALVDLSAQGVGYTTVGDINLKQANDMLPLFAKDAALTFNIDLAQEKIGAAHTDLLFEIIRTNASKTFNFTYTFNNAPSSPYFPSARYERDGFAIGLQPTDLSAGCTTLDEWLENMKRAWHEIADIFADDDEFLGIDSSVAPLLEGTSSFVNFVRRLGLTFEQSVTTNIYTTITAFIKEQNPKPIGLCGMMLPCLEDFELAEEYADGKFTIERNIFLSLHSGLGIDTYPIGIDEKPERVVEILELLQSLSNKYEKPLSARFVSDGQAKIGDKSDFQNQYLQDCVIQAL